MHNKAPRVEIARIVTERILAEPSNAHKWMQALAAFLVENRRSAEADLIINDIARELAIQAGLLNVEIVSARALNDATRVQLKNYLKSVVDAKEINLHETVDESILGGIIARTPDAELDLSVSKKLRQLTGIA